MPARPLRWSLGLGLLLGTSAAHGTSAPEGAPVPEPTAGASSLPPPDREALGPRAPTPGWDVGILAGVCGVGRTAVWEGTEFCGALLADVLWFRETRHDVGFGVYALTGTAGFYDFRASLGPELHVPLGQLFAAGLRAGPLLHVMGDGAAPGFTVQGEFGIRALNQSGPYTLMHALVIGWDQSFGDGSRVGSALTIALRVDGFWLAAPFGMIF